MRRGIVHLAVHQAPDRAHVVEKALVGQDIEEPRALERIWLGDAEGQEQAHQEEQATGKRFQQIDQDMAVVGV